MTQKNQDFFLGSKDIPKSWLITHINFIALPHFSLEVEFEQLLREMAGSARQAEGAVVWVELET